ncbi:hypothetical protein [Neomegalonema perideroedes]|uniref:hypothetical protein n=1 Tax=Neomegalonema perideroedes TaxID=217219 RepID=UPI0012FDDF7F|nr:hypothetical protein [Neomegalonema perideroedes]
MRKQGLGSMKSALAAAVLALAATAPGFGPSDLAGYAQAASPPASTAPAEVMSLKIDGGVSLALERVAPPRPEVFAGAPAYALWTREGFAEPVRFRLSSNHAAYVRSWRLAVYRSGDLERRRPVQSFSGRGASYAEAQVWDGSVAPGVARLRPGEELFYVFEATDRMGRVAASDPAPLLLARYVMPQQARTLKPQAQATALSERPEMAQGQAYGLRVKLAGLKAGEILRLDGMILTADSSGSAEFTQILPPGRYAPKIELTRARGRTAQAELAFALGDPAEGLQPRPLWGAGSAAAVALARPAAVPTRSAHYELANQTMIYLPDTDVARDSVRAVIMVEGETAAALSAGEHYVLDSLQGRLALTSAGRDLMDGIAQGLEEGGQTGRLEIGYRPIAELEPADAAPSAPVAAASGDGADFVVTYGDALGPEALFAAAEALIAETLAEGEAEEAQEDKGLALAAAPAPAPAPKAAAAAEKVELAQAGRPDHPLESPAPRAKPRTAAPAVLLAEAAPLFDDPGARGLAATETAKPAAPLAVAAPVLVARSAAPPVVQIAAQPAARKEEPSLVAQGLFIAASAPAGFDAAGWSEETPKTPARLSAAPPPAARSLAEILTQGFILDKD